jgi:iron(III) transport system substrate-binding protein
MRTGKAIFTFGRIVAVASTTFFALVSAGSAQTVFNWKERWDKTVAEAKKEGTVVVFSSAGQRLRQAMTQEFEKAFPGIRVEYTGGRESDHGNRIISERTGGIFRVDVVVSGPSTTHLYLGPAKALDPIEPVLILPEVTNLKNWRDNKHHYSDAEEKYNLVFLGQTSPVLAYTPGLKPDELDGLDELLAPKWKGRIIVNDPVPPGAGHSFGRWLWRVLGPEKATDYLKKLRAQAGAVDRDLRRQLEWVAQGRYDILVAPGTSQLEQLLEQGIKIGVVAEVKGTGGWAGTWLTSGPGTAMLINKAPHPNAAAVFINWLLSKEGQTKYSVATNAVSRRVDISTDHLPNYMVPAQGKKYWLSYVEAVTRRSPEEEAVIKEVFGR